MKTGKTAAADPGFVYGLGVCVYLDGNGRLFKFWDLFGQRKKENLLWYQIDVGTYIFQWISEDEERKGVQRREELRVKGYQFIHLFNGWILQWNMLSFYWTTYLK